VPVVYELPTDSGNSQLAARHCLSTPATRHHGRTPRASTGELRCAPRTLEPKQLLSALPPVVGRIVHTLLTAEGRFSQQELADRADVSARTVLNYRNRLEALDPIRVDENGYRLALSYQITTERRDPIVPTVLEENQTLLGAVDSLLEMFLPPDRYGDPNDPLGSALFWPPDPLRLLNRPTVGPWLRVAAALTPIDCLENKRTLQLGPPLRQQSFFRTPS
jgi:hypothetical protein